MNTEDTNTAPVKQQLKPGDVRVVNINGRPTTLVIGREYEFKLKPGCAPQPNEETTKRAGREPKKENAQDQSENRQTETRRRVEGHCQELNGRC